MPSNVVERAPGRFAARRTVRGAVEHIGTFSTREEAERAVQAARATPEDFDLMTVAQFDAEWQLLALARGGRTRATTNRLFDGTRGFVNFFRANLIHDGFKRDALVRWAVKNPENLRYAKTFMADAVWAGATDVNPLEDIVVKVAPKDPGEDDGSRVPSSAEVGAIVRHLPTTGLQGFALVAAWGGLRLCECARVQAAHVGRERLLGGAIMLAVCGKGDRPRDAVVFNPGASALLALLPDSGPVFVNARGNLWTRGMIAHHMRKACADAGVEGVTMHGFRKHWATWALDHGASDLDVAVNLGHTSRAGVPNAELVRKIYGRPSGRAALDRLVEVGHAASA